MSISQWCHQPSPPLSSPSPPAFNLSQHQSFPVSQLFTSGGQNIRASASASVPPGNSQGCFPLRFDWFLPIIRARVSKHDFIYISNIFFKKSERCLETKVFLGTITLAATFTLFLGKVSEVLYGFGIWDRNGFCIFIGPLWFLWEGTSSQGLWLGWDYTTPGGQVALSPVLWMALPWVPLQPGHLHLPLRMRQVKDRGSAHVESYFKLSSRNRGGDVQISSHSQEGKKKSFF